MQQIRKNVLADINTKKCRLDLAEALDLTEQSIIRLIKVNSDDLTKAAALAVIRKHTKKTDSQILK